jgi:aspartyl-tRNA(Asn)/glutamyl-tRNA(Gln) amidotransferase subunit A
LGNLAGNSAIHLKKLLDQGLVSSVDIMHDVLERIREREVDVKAYLTVAETSEVLRQAQLIDNRRANRETIGVLAGLPIAIKDNLCTRAMKTTCASKMLATFVPPYDATVVKRILAADGIVIGKTNLDEFSMGSSTENSAFHPTRNPHDLDRVPGGTSGGSAAAVAAQETILALGSDTGGSIRQPASFCGVVGLKPTYGRVSRYGLIAFASSLDQVGPITKTVADSALLLSVIAGRDPQDSTSSSADVPDYVANLNSTDSMTFGVPFAYLQTGIDQEVRDLFVHLLTSLENAGHKVVEVSLPHTEYSIPTYYILSCAEASSNLARFDGVRYGYRSVHSGTLKDMYQNTRGEGFGPEVKRRIMLGTYVLSHGYYDAYYNKASRVRTLIKNDFGRELQKCDTILHPVSPLPPFRIGEKIDDPLAMYLADIYTVSANLAGVPAISVPSGSTKTGLPVGVQVTAGHFREDLLFAAAMKIEKVVAESSPR